MSFGKDVEKFADKVEKAALAIFHGTSLDLFGKIVKRTPVDTGRLRGNWYATINTPSNQIDSGDQNRQQIVSNAKLGESVFFVNNLPYASQIENGSSAQAPSGMVKVTITEFETIVSRNARKNRK